MLKSVIVGCGSYLPEKILTNADISKIVDTDDQWIKDRTGIERRHVIADNEMTSDMAAKASERALFAAGLKPDKIDLIIVATTTPDNTFPSTASRVQALLKAKNAAAFDVQAVCSGFIYAIATADNFIKSGMYQNVLVIGADALTRIVDWKDRGTCVLFGDGAGAIILQAAKSGKRGILTTNLFSDGSTRELLYVDGGVSFSGTAGKIRMQGKEVFKHAVQKMSDSLLQSLKKAKLKTKDIHWLIPHQANVRILDATADKLGIPKEKVVITVDKHANTSAASIPLALDVAWKDGRIKKNNIVALQAIGGGLTWGSCIIRW